MEVLRCSSLFICVFWITTCMCNPYHKRDYPNTSGNSGGGSYGAGPSGGRGGFGGQMSNGGGASGGNGINPFKIMANGASAGKGGSPFTSGSGNGDGKGSGGMGAGPFAGAMNNGGGAGSGSGGMGNGAGPFASAAAGGSNGAGSGGGASPFAAAMGSGGGSSSNGAGPFAGSGSGSGPFNANAGNGNGMPGIDFSSLLSTGPGGLSGGDFLTGNATMLMGHDFSKNLDSGGQYGNMGVGQGQGENQMGIDNSRFDTSEYQNMLQGLFNTDNAGKELTDMGTPFDGSAYNYDTGKGEHYNTAMESSVGSFASTDMSSYSGNSGAATGQGSVQYQGGLQNGNGAGGSPNMASSGSTSSNSNMDVYSNPFNANSYNKPPTQAHSSSNSDSSSTYQGQNPFDTSRFNSGKNPFSGNNNYNGGGTASGNGVGTGSGPFDTSKFGMMNGNSNKQMTGGQNPFDTSKYQSGGTFGGMMGNEQYQNIGTGANSNNNGLDEYGNVNFASLSGLSGNAVDTGSVGGLGMPDYSAGTSTYSAKPQGSATYSGFQDGVGSGQYGTGSGTSYSGTASYVSSGSGYTGVSENQYQTPFEADNYNDLLGNPFKSDSYFDTTRQNFKLPYEHDSTLSQSSQYRGQGHVSSYGGSNYGAVGSGPGGNPFNQGGHSVQGPNGARGRRRVHGRL